MPYSSILKITLMAFCLVLFKGCLFGGSETEGRDGGSETEGLHGKLIFENGTPAEGAIVRAQIKPDSTTTSKLGVADTIAIDTTDDKGRYSFTDLDSATYTISGTWWNPNVPDTLKAYRDSVDFDGKVKDVGIDTLLPPGKVSLQITINSIEGIECYIPGISPVFKPNADGECLIINIPPGTYTLSYGKSGYLTNHVQVVVLSEKTTSLSDSRLYADPNNSPPTPQNIAGSYDISSGIATIIWDSVYVGDLHGYRIYRSTNGGSFSLIDTVSDNRFLDTLFRDMVDTNSIVLQFRIQSIDHDGNPSNNSNTVEVVAVHPNKPSLPVPYTGYMNVSLTPKLEWTDVSPIHGELPFYEIFLGVHPDSMISVVTGLADTFFVLSGLQPETNYYWQIITTVGDSIIIGSIWTFSTRINHAPYPPTLKFPQKNQVGLDTALTLIWSGWDADPTDELRYSLYFRTDSTNLSLLVEGTKDTLWPLENLAPGTRYYWRVVAKDNLDSTFSSISTFVTYKAPQNINLLSPVPEARGISRRPTFTWQVERGTQDSLTLLLIGEDSTDLSPMESLYLDSSVTLSNELKPGTEYYWKILFLDGKTQLESEIRSFITNSLPGNPQIIYPPNGGKIRDTTVQLDWMATDPDSQDQITFYLHIGTDSLNLTSLDSQIVSPTFLTSSWQLGDTVYWKIISVTNNGDSISGDLWSFAINTPPDTSRILFPPFDTTLYEGTVHFSWSASDSDNDSLTHRVYLGKDSSNLVLLDTLLTDNTLQVPNLDEGETYFWKVVTSDALDSTTSNMWRFHTYSAPANLTLLSPDHEAVSVPRDISFSWQVEDGSQTHSIHFLFGEDSANLNLLDSISTNSQYSLQNLTPGKTYWWQLILNDRQTQIQSEKRTFTTNALPTKPQLVSPTLSSKLKGTSATLQWESMDSDPSDQLTFGLFVGTDSNNLQKIDSIFTDKNYLLTGLSVGIPYFWKVTAITDNKDTVMGETWLFSMNSPPNIPHSPAPHNDTLDSLGTNLLWIAEDSEGDTLAFAIYFGKDSTNLNLLKTDVATNNIRVDSLEKATQYFWKIVSTDFTDTTESPIWNFYSKPNAPPNVPQLVFPSLDTTFKDTSITLEWSTTDSDAGDTLRYTVLFGEDSTNMSAILTKSLSTTFNLPTPDNFKTYFWRVLAYDGIDSTQSPAWRFKTDFPGLVAHWDFNEGSGSVLNDKSGNGYHAQIIGAVRAEGAEGNALLFDGQGDYVNIPEVDAFKLQQYTLVAWVRTRPFKNSLNHIVFSNQYAPTGISEGIAIQYRQDTLANGYAPISGESWSGIDAVVGGMDNLWHQIAVTRNNDTYTLYFDGEVVATKLDPRLIDYGDFNPTIGAAQGHTNIWAPSYFEGEIDEIKIFNYAMSTDSIRSLFESITPPTPTPQLIAHWDFNEGSGTTLNDKSGKNYSGTISGATWVDGVEGKALSFDGDGDFVEVFEVDAFKLQQYSILVWLKPESLLVSQSHVIFSNLHAQTGTSEGINIEFINGFLANGYGPINGEHWNNINSTVGGIDDSWHQVVFTKSLTTMKMYWDGQLIESKQELRLIEFGNIKPNIGASMNSFNSNWPSYYEGDLDEIKIFNLPLEPDSITALYNSIKP